MERQERGEADDAAGATLAQWAVLMARLEAQDRRIEAQAAEIARLRAEVAAPGSSGATPASPARRGGRRALIGRLVGATAAAALLAVAKQAPTVQAATLTTVLSPGSSTADYGLVATAGAGSPSGSISNLGGHSFGVIGVGLNPVITAPASAGVLGMDYFGHGTIGLSREGVGVYGESMTFQGVRGVSANGTGVRGTSFGSSGQNYGVWGYAGVGRGVNGTSDDGIGVYGLSTNGVGVYGVSTAQIGVRGDSVNNYGVYGRSSLTALRGEATGAGVGFVGLAVNPEQGGTAGYFLGGVTVQGNFTAFGGAKSAAVPHPDGSHRRVYCQESPEAWFEDFGTATLTNGRAVVDLDPDFDAVVKGDDYLVFVVPEGDCKGLFVSRKGPHRFVVEELQGGKSTLPFSYRVVSRRRENVGRRLEKVDVKGPPLPKIVPQAVGPDGRR